MDWLLFLFFESANLAQAIILLSFSGEFVGKKPKSGHYILCCLLFVLCGWTGRYLHSSLLSAGLYTAVLYCVIWLFMGSRKLESGLTSVLAASIMQLSYGIVNGLMSVALPYLEPAMLGLAGMAGSVLSLAIGFFCCRFTARKFPLNRDGSDKYLALILAPVLFVFALGYYVVAVVYGNTAVIPFPREPGKYLELLAIQVIGLAALFSTLYAYQRLCEGFQLQSRLALLERETQAQKMYVTEAKARYERTKAFRHDIRSHLTVLHGLLKTGRTQQAAEYLEKIESMGEELSFPKQTGIPVLDILLGNKAEAARQSEIVIDCSLAPLQSCRIVDFDLCVIFSNALDNAVEACSKLSGTKVIRVIGERQGEFYLLEFINHCGAARAEQPEMGTGLMNIKTVAEKYGGALTIEQQDGLFCLDVLLHIS